MSLKRLLAIVMAVGWAMAAQAPSGPGIDSQTVITHLNQTIAWYEHVTAAQPSGAAPDNVVFADNVRQSSQLVVQRAFAFARAQAALLAKQSTAAVKNGAVPQDLSQYAERANARTSRIQGQIEDLNRQLATQKKRKVIATLTSQRDALTAELSFSKLTQSALKDMMTFASGNEKSGGLLGQINLLANSDSVPAALSNTTTAVASGPKTAAPDTFHAETAGIFSLITNAFGLLRTQGAINNLLDETVRLDDQVKTLVTPLRTKARDLMAASDRMANVAAQESDPAKLESARLEIEQMSVQFKAFSGPTLPLSEQSIAIESTRTALEQWRDASGSELRNVLGYLAFRVGTLAVIIAVLLIASEIVRRTAFRYVHDTRRRRQIVLIRRFVVATLVTLLVVLTSVSGLGSFATIAGFVTAGLAVALQNVILSVVAYFFLIGRYGIRTGDRVTVTNLTGDVIEVGLVRFYMMELAGTGTDLHATGRVAVFSNSVIFQPSALIKQAPGTEYAWHSVSTTLAEEANVEEGRKRITSAVEAVYNNYRDAIVQQQQSFERTTNVQLKASGPVTRTRLTDTGMEVVVRYPVEILQMSEVDEEMILSVLHETQKEPPLKLAPGGFPKIVATG